MRMINFTKHGIQTTFRVKLQAELHRSHEVIVESSFTFVKIIPAHQRVS